MIISVSMKKLLKEVVEKLLNLRCVQFSEIGEWIVIDKHMIIPWRISMEECFKGSKLTELRNFHVLLHSEMKRRNGQLSCAVKSKYGLSLGVHSG